jgi:hypothetical protein
MTLTPWTSRGCDSIFNFVVGSRSGWVERDDSHHYKDRPTIWRVVLSGADGRAYRQVEMPLKRGRTMKAAVSDALRAFPVDVTTDVINGREIFGTFSTIE